MAEEQKQKCLGGAGDVSILWLDLRKAYFLEQRCVCVFHIHSAISQLPLITAFWYHSKPKTGGM